MKLADQIIELMEPFPGRPFRMQEIVNYVNPRAREKRDKEAIRKQARVVLEQLSQTGSVNISPRERNGSQALYSWKSGSLSS